MGRYIPERDKSGAWTSGKHAACSVMLTAVMGFSISVVSATPHSPAERVSVCERERVRVYVDGRDGVLDFGGQRDAAQPCRDLGFH